MNLENEDFHALYEKINEISARLHALSVTIERVQEYCRNEKLIPNQELDDLKKLLKEYTERTEPLYKYCSATQTALDTSLALIGKQVLQQIQENDVKKWRDEAIPFSTLTCQIQNICEELNNAKDELKTILEKNDSVNIKDEILPFWAVVKNVAGEEISDSACASMESKFSGEFYRAVYRGQFSFSTNVETQISVKNDKNTQLFPLCADKKNLLERKVDFENTTKPSGEVLDQEKSAEAGISKPERIQKNLICQGSQEEVEQTACNNKFTVICDAFNETGTLICSNSGKTPKSSSSLTNDSQKRGADFLRGIRTISVLILESKQVTQKLLKQQLGDGVSEITISRVIDYLYKEGYLDRYALSNQPENSIFELTLAGGNVLEKESWQKSLKKRIKLDPFHHINGVGDFLRLEYAFDILSQSFTEEAPKINMTSINGYIILIGYLDSSENEADFVILPSVLTKDEPLELLQKFLQAVSAEIPNATKSLRTFVLATNEEHARAWQKIYQSHCTCFKQSQFYLGRFDNDVLSNSEGERFSLFELFQSNQSHATSTDNETIVAAVSALTESREEPASENTCTEGPAIETCTKRKNAFEAELIGCEEPVEAVTENTVQMLPCAAKLARQLEQNPTLPNQISTFYPLFTCLLYENSSLEATVFAKALVANGTVKGADIFYDALLHATNLPLDHRIYSSSHLELGGALFDGTLLHYLHIAAMAWALSFPAIPYDHNLYNSFKSTQDMELNMFSESMASVKRVFTLLTGEMKDLSFEHCDGAMFSPGVLDLLLSDVARRNRRSKICANARTKLGVPHSSIGITGLESLMKEMMGPLGKIGRCLQYISDNDVGHYSEIAETFRQFTDSSTGQISQSRLDDHIDLFWDDLRQRDSRIKLKRIDNESPARNTVKRELQHRLELIADWLSLASGHTASVNHPALEKLQATKKRLQRELANACAEGTVQLQSRTLPCTKAAGIQVICSTFRQINEILNGGMHQKSPEKVFACLLTSNEPILNEDGVPWIDPQMESVCNMEPWRVMLRHIASEKKSLQEALKQIESDDPSSDRFDDFGSAQLLRRALDLPEVDYSQSYQAAEKVCLEDEESFKSEVRLWNAYGRIAEYAKENVFVKLEQFRGAFQNTHNYAHFQRFLDALRSEINAEYESRKSMMEAELEKRVELNARAKIQVPQAKNLLDQIKKEISNGNFAMAEEYQNRYDARKWDKDVHIGQIETEQDFHSLFVEQADRLYSQCERSENKGRNLRDWGFKVVRTCNNWTSSNEGVDAESLVNSWILFKGDPRASGRIQQFLNGVGFTVSDVSLSKTERPTSQYEVYSASVVPARAGQKDYAHPVAKFGTKQEAILKVVCLFGCKGASTLIDIMTQRLQLNAPTIVLMDGVLSVMERRRVATKFKSMTSGQNSFLLIDRVLLLFLAMQDRGNRMNAMLRCTLPYTFEQLYTEGSGPVADEMFIGRIKDRNAICNEDGACLVYGGRQLGKTALLRRAESILNQPEDGRYAFYVDIKNEGLASLIEKLNGKLGKLEIHGRVLLGKSCSTLQEICNVLEARASDFNRLSIFVDEVDYFFEEISADNYEKLHPIVLLRQATKNRVKFVFAGTHNVAATTQAIKDNGDILQLGKPWCISPLSASDARRLIDWPLSYLGFKLGDQQMALILANTNSYPGLIHLFCNALIKSVCEEYGKYYNEQSNNPPYPLSDEQLKAIFKETDLKKEIETRVIATIMVDQKYKIVSSLIAYLDYENLERDQLLLYGYTAEELLNCNEREFQIQSFMPSKMTVQDMDALLAEMEKMGILWENPSRESYRFRQRDFLGYIGTGDQVISNLLEESGGNVL